MCFASRGECFGGFVCCFSCSAFPRRGGVGRPEPRAAGDVTGAGKLFVCAGPVLRCFPSRAAEGFVYVYGRRCKDRETNFFATGEQLGRGVEGGDGVWLFVALISRRSKDTVQP